MNVNPIDPFSGYEDPLAGIEEQFLTPRIDGGRTIAVLSRPLMGSRSFGWVICHSFGIEQENLQSFEAALARRLAADGFPVLRYQSQGYGDSDLPTDRVSVASHVQGAADAIHVLRDASGVAAAGSIGAKFGGTVAMLAAERVRGPAVAMIDPIVNGRAYMRGFIRSSMVSALSGDGSSSGADGSAADPIVTLRRDGWIDVHGFPLRSAVFDEISQLELDGIIETFDGRSLVMQVSRSATPRRDIEAIAGRLREAGGTCDRTIFEHRNALRFGLPPFRAVGAATKEDTMGDLRGAIIEAVVTWCGSVTLDRQPGGVE